MVFGTDAADEVDGLGGVVTELRDATSAGAVRLQVKTEDTKLGDFRDRVAVMKELDGSSRRCFSAVKGEDEERRFGGWAGDAEWANGRGDCL